MRNLVVRRLGLTVICIVFGLGMNAQIGSDDGLIMKSEMSRMALSELNNNYYDLDYALIVVKPHMPVLISTDTKNKHLKIEVNQPDKDQLSIIISDNQNNKIIKRDCKCKSSIRIGLNKVKCDTFRINIYHIEGGFLLATQEIRKR